MKNKAARSGRKASSPALLSRDQRSPERRARQDLAILKEQLMDHVEQLQSWHLVNEETTNVVNYRTDGGGWELLGSAWKGHIAQNQLVMIAEARKFFRFNAMARAAIMGVVKYVMGKGVTITPKSKDPRIWYIWREFWTSERNNMHERQFEIVKRYFRDGEVYLIYFSKDKGGNNTWRSTVRFLDPIDIRFSGEELPLGYLTDKTNQGVTFDPDDAERPLEYFVRNRNQPEKLDRYSADIIQRKRFPLADMDQARGESFLQQAMPYFTQFKQWLENRIVLNKLRTAIVMIQEIDGTSADIARVANSLPSSPRAKSGDNKSVNIRPGTIYRANPGVKLRMDAPNINASDVKDDGRAIILQICAATGLPEYMFGDASNANYASSLVSESPTVKEIEYHQTMLEGFWKDMFRRVIKAAVDAGKLQEPADEDVFAKFPNGAADLSEQDDGEGEEGDEKNETAQDDAEETDNYQETEREIFYGCDVEWPTIVHRDPQQEAAALSVYRQQGWISDETAASKIGLDYNEEVRKQRKIEETAKISGNPLLGVADPDDVNEQGALQQDKEEQDAMSMFSDDEKQKIMMSTDPMQIGKMLLSKMKTNGANKNGKQNGKGNGNDK